MDKPKANLISHTPSGHRLPYWDRYEFKCVDCGSIYIRSANTSRINPYCADCSRKHEKERVKIRNAKKQEMHDANVRADAIDELVHSFDEYVKSNPKTSYYWTEFLCELKKIAEQVKQNTL